MLTFYLCFLVGGVVLPLLNYLVGFFFQDFDGDLHSDLDTGADPHTEFDMDATTAVPPIFTVGLVPTSLLSLSTLAIVFGASGALMTIGKWNIILIFILASVYGYLSAVLIQTIINTLKKAQTVNNGVDENELAMYDGKVIDTILPGQYGTVSFSTLKNVLVSYPAKCVDENMRLETGRIVVVKEFQNGIFIVEPKNKYE